MINNNLLSEGHSLFIKEREVLYDNAKSITWVGRDHLLEPEAKVGAVYASRLEMLEEKQAERQNTPCPATLEHLSYSDIPRASFDAEITLTTDLPSLGLEENESFPYRNQYFYHNSLNGSTYIGSDGEVHEVHHAVASSLDRSTDELIMARVLVDAHGSVFYGGRPDTELNAIQQGVDIFRTEMSHLGTEGKPIPRDADGIYELTYVVDSLTSGGKLQHPNHLNERKSLEREKTILKELRNEPINVDGMWVRLKPIHVHHTLNCWAELSPILPKDTSGLQIEDAINAEGYQELIAFAKTKPKDPLTEGIIYHLEKGNLAVHERFFLIDLLAKKVQLPVVHHCKSLVSRTALAASVSMITQLIAYNDIPFEKIPQKEGKCAPHLLMQSEDFKHLFLAGLNIQHQVCRDAVFGILPDGKLTGFSQLSISQHEDPFGLIPTVLGPNLFPKETVKPSWLADPTTKTTALTMGGFLLSIAVITGIYHLVILGITLYFSKKTRVWQKDFGIQMSLLPFYIIWYGYRAHKIQLSTTLNLDSKEINGRDRALVLGAKTAPIPKGKEDPRYALFPKHLYTNTL